MTDTFKYDYNKDHSLSHKWRFRFDFFEKNGAPDFWKLSPAWKAAFNTMSFSEKIKINCNFIAYFFSFIYLLVLGLWRKAILILILNFVVGIIIAITGFAFLGFIVNILTAMRVNIWYYQLKVHNIHDWSI